MQTVIKKITELKRPEKNVRLHGDRQIKEYIRSIEMFGQIRPLVIDEDNVVLAGNGLLTALKEMGRETADCYVVQSLTSKQKKKLMLVDNKIFELGVNNANVFDELLRELDGDIDIPGYDEELLKVLTPVKQRQMKSFLTTALTVKNQFRKCKMYKAKRNHNYQNHSRNRNRRKYLGR